MNTNAGNSEKENIPIGMQQRDHPPNPQSEHLRRKRRRFFKFATGSFLYCLSALSILCGIAQIVGPVLARTNALAKTLPCLGVLNLYELALLAALLLLVLWRNVTDDAVFLVILISLFLIASGVTLDTIANDNPPVAAAVGVGCFVLGGMKLWAMRRYIAIRLERLLMIAAAVLLAWNFLLPPILAVIVRNAHERAIAVERGWLIGWLVMLCGGVLMLVHSVRTPTGAARPPDTHIPFLRTSGMAWVFALILLAAANVHQLALTFIFDLSVSFGDFLPIVGLAALLTLELMRNYGKKFAEEHIVVSVVPLAAVLFAVFTGTTDRGFSLDVGLLWHPPVLIAVLGPAILWISLRNRWQKLLPVVGAYVVCALLTVGGESGHPETFNWEWSGWLVGASLFILSLLLRKVALAMFAVVLFSVTGGASSGLRAFADAHALPIAGIVGLIAGFGTVLVHAIFRKKLPRAIAFAGAAVLSLSVMVCFGPQVGAITGHHAIASGLIAAVLGVGLCLRTRDFAVAASLLVPLIRGIYIGLEGMAGWRYAILSFLLLAGGVLVSLRKSRTGKTGAG
ncbi:MAG: hypothetical protein Q8Q12_12775 [bacterium]|nr:hypothetical protein [bacterium]